MQLYSAFNCIVFLYLNIHFVYIFFAVFVLSVVYGESECDFEHGFSFFILFYTLKTILCYFLYYFLPAVTAKYSCHGMVLYISDYLSLLLWTCHYHELLNKEALLLLKKNITVENLISDCRMRGWLVLE